MRVAAIAGAGLLTALAAGRGAPDSDDSLQGRGQPVRVLLGSTRTEARLPAQTGWRLVDDRRRALARDASGDRWSILRDGRRLRPIRNDVPAGSWYEASLVLEPGPDGLVTWGGKQYRGELVFTATDTAIMVVNRLEVEEYLRGVLPLEIGARQADDHAAVEAQAVAARSFTYVRMRSAGAQPFDVRATDSDQVYGGAGAETFWGDLAVAATAGWVLSHQGRVATAPYHAACGGSTALPSDVWRGGQDGFLRAVSDTNPATGRPWCDLAPRVAWQRRLTGEDLSALIRRYAAAYVSLPGGSPASIQDARVVVGSAGGRVRELVLTSGASTVTLRGNDIRYVLRGPAGELLPSTSFSLNTERTNAQVTAVVLSGRGNGHGVGLCQWGAIARARAGADFRAILKAYFPNAELTRAP